MAAAKEGTKESPGEGEGEGEAEAGYQSETQLLPFAAPTELPSVLARLTAFGAVMIAAVCGGLIGSSVVELQCSQTCTWPQLSGATLGAAFCAVGVALIAVLVLRSKGEWAAEAASRPKRPGNERS